jgi:fructuronate reductase
MRLSQSSAASLPADVARFNYDRDARRIGIVHLGIGAFHRAHEAVYTDGAMEAGDRDWMIAGISLRSAAVRDQLAPQDGLYTVTDSATHRRQTRLIGAIREVHVAPADPSRVTALIADRNTHITSLTVTEKGYLRNSDRTLNAADPAVANDLEGTQPPRTLYGHLGAALAQRRATGLPGITILCCDNLASNGQQLAHLLEAFLDRRDPALASWFRRECSCPSTMVDRIVPASTAQDLDAVAARLGQRDEGAVFTEPFSQWVIEDRFAAIRPRWELAGAQFVRDVRPFEIAKLRLLNGAHSALAYLGLFRGHEFVHQAIADPGIRRSVESLMREAATTLPEAPGLDIPLYISQLLERFSNAALAHRLAQIAMDGSQKLPQRWLPTLRHRQSAGQRCEALLHALAAWITYVRGDRFVVDDPGAAALAALWQAQGREGMAAALFGPTGLFSRDWTANEENLEALRRELARIEANA